MPDQEMIEQAREEAAKFFGYGDWANAQENGGTHGPEVTARLAEVLLTFRNAALDEAAGVAHKAIIDQAFSGNGSSPGDCSAAAYHAILSLKTIEG